MDDVSALRADEEKRLLAASATSPSVPASEATAGNSQTTHKTHYVQCNVCKYIWAWLVNPNFCLNCGAQGKHDVEWSGSEWVKL